MQINKIDDGNIPTELVVRDVDVVETQFDEFAVVVVDFQDRLFGIGGVGRFERQRFGL